MDSKRYVSHLLYLILTFVCIVVCKDASSEDMGFRTFLGFLSFVSLGISVYFGKNTRD